MSKVHIVCTNLKTVAGTIVAIPTSFHDDELGAKREAGERNEWLQAICASSMVAPDGSSTPMVDVLAALGLAEIGIGALTAPLRGFLIAPPGKLILNS